MPEDQPYLPPQFVLDPVSFGVLIVDEQFRLIQYNAWALKHLNPHLDQMLHRPLDEIFPELVERNLMNAYQMVLESHQPLYLSKPSYPAFFRIPHPKNTTGLLTTFVPNTAQQQDTREMEQTLTIFPFMRDGKTVRIVTLITDITEKADAERVLIEYNRRLQIINEIDQGLAALPPLQALHLLLQRSQTLLQVETAMLLVRQNNDLTLWKHETTTRQIPSSSLAGWVALNRRQAVTSKKIDQDGHLLIEAAVPLLTGGQLLGVLAFQGTRRVPFSPIDLLMAEGLASRGAAVLLSQQLTEKEEQSRCLNQVLMHSLSQLRLHGQLEDRLEVLFTQMQHILTFDSGLILQLSGDRCRVIFQHGYEAFGLRAEVARLEPTLNEFANLRITQSTRTLRIIADTTCDPLWQPIPSIPHVRSWIGAPIQVNGKVTAFLSLDKTQPAAFQNVEPEVITAFTDLLGLILESDPTPPVLLT